MKRSLILAVVLMLAAAVKAQIQNPVHWTCTSKKVNSTTYEVHITATIDAGWHIYSQHTPEGGPVPSSVEFTKNPLVTLDGETKEVGKLEKKYEDMFEVDVHQFSGKVDFVQVVKVKANVKTTVAGSIKFMSCNDKQCLPPANYKFSTTLQ